MQLFAKFKKILRRGFRATLNFRISILSCCLQFNNKTWGSQSSFLSYKRLKLKLRVFLAGHTVAMATCCATKLTATCSPMIGQFVDTHDLRVNRYKVIIMTHQTES